MIIAVKVLILLGFVLWAFGLSYRLGMLGYIVGRVGAAMAMFAGVAIFHQNPALAKETLPRVFIASFVVMVAVDALSFVIRKAPIWVRVFSASLAALVGIVSGFLAF